MSYYAQVFPEDNDEYGEGWDVLSEYEYDPCDSENECNSGNYYDILSHASEILNVEVIGRNVHKTVKQLEGCGWGSPAIMEFLEYLYKRESQRFHGSEVCYDMPICRHPEKPLDQMEKIEDLFKIYSKV